VSTPEPGTRSHTTSERSHTTSQNDDTDEDVSFASESSRKSISFYVPVEPAAAAKSGSPFGKSPSRPRSATAKSPARPGPASRPRSATTLTTPADTPDTSSRRIRHDSYTISSSEDREQQEGAALVITKFAQGFLCRALLKSNKVQEHVKTIRDTNDLLKGYNTGTMTKEDYAFYNTLQSTLTQTRDKVAVIFFSTPRSAQLVYIANSRAARREKQIREISQRPSAKRGAKKMRQKAWI